MRCKICDQEEFFVGIDLGKQPLAHHFLKESELGKEPFYPLRVVVCEHCSAAQLDCTVPKEIVYTEHTYLSGITRSLADHFEKVAQTVDSRFFQAQTEKAVLDIGSNDGTQLKAYQRLGYQVLGVESVKKIAEIANQAGVPTLAAFYNLETADRIGEMFDVINASGVFFHLEELHSVTQAIQKYLKPNGVFVVQFLYMKSIMENGAFDQIYHEHLLYYTLRSLDHLLQRHGLALFDAEFSPIHGGSIMGYVTHRGARSPTSRLLELKRAEAGCDTPEAYRRFTVQVGELKQKSLQFLEERRGKNIYGMGAPVKGNTLLNYFGIGRETLSCLVEKNELRRGLFSPGRHLPILIEKETPPPDVYFVLAWNFKEEILKNNAQTRVEFFFPIEPKK